MDDIKLPLGESGPRRRWIRFNINGQPLPWRPVECLNVAHFVATSDMRYLATAPVCLPHSSVFGNAFSFPWLMARWLEFPRSGSKRSIGNRKAHFLRAPLRFRAGPSLRASPLQSIKDDQVDLKVAQDQWKMAVTHRDKLPVFFNSSGVTHWAFKRPLQMVELCFHWAAQFRSACESLYMQFQNRDQYWNDWSVLSFSLAPF